MITITIDNTQALAAVERLRRACRNLKPVMADISEVMLEEVRENFDRQGRPAHWVDLDATTKAARAKRNKWPGKILQESGMLKNTIFPSANHDSAMVTAPAEYAAIHNFGGITGRGHKTRIPARPFMVLTKDTEEQIGDLVLDHLKTAFEGS